MGQEWDANGKPIQPVATGAPTEWDASGKPIASASLSSTTPAPEGFWHSLGAAFGVTPEAAQEKIQNMKDHPVKAAIAAAAGPAWELAKGVGSQVKQSAGEVSQAADAINHGSVAGMAQHLIQAVPIVGPAISKGADQYASGDYAGEAGTLLGASAQVAPLVAGAADSAIPGRPTVSARPIVRAVGRVALLGKTPEGAIEGVLKQPTTLSPVERAANAKTLLQNEIPVSKGGVQKISDLIDDYNQKIAGEIASDPNRPIDPNAVATRADLAKAKFSKQVNASGDIAAIDASKQQFLAEQGAPTNNQGSVTGPAPAMGAADAQAMKQGTYRVLSGKYGEQGSASVEAQKALARGLKEEIATQFPEIANLNAAESKLLDLQPVLERAVSRIGNRESPVGIGGPILATGAKAMTGSNAFAATVGILKSVLGIPELQSRIAIAVSKASKVPYSQALSRVKSYSASLGSAALAQQGNSTSGNPDQATISGASQ